MQKIAPKDRYSHNEVKSLNWDDVISGVLIELGIASETASIDVLSGGFMNSNFRLTSGGESSVIRIYSTDLTTAKREYDLLRFLEGHAACVPKPYALIENLRKPVITMQFLDGITFQDRLCAGPVDLAIFSEMGRKLAAIHKIEFDKCGFITPNVMPGNEYENFPTFIRDFIDKTLDWLSGHQSRLDLTTAERVRHLIREKWDFYFSAAPKRQLVHCDFNPKNLIVSRSGQPKLLGIIDWEFCLSGDGLIDLGNFFRFEYDFPDGAANAFQEGYQMAGGKLDIHWRDAAMLLDLGNMFSFLERREDYQASFRTARAVINSTLEHFGY